LKFFRRTTRGTVSAEPEKKPPPWPNPKSQVKTEGNRQLRHRCCTPRPQTWQACTAGRQRPTVAPARAGPRVLGAYRRQDGACGCQSESRIAGGTEPNALSGSGKTGRKGCRRPGRRGEHAGHSPRPAAAGRKGPRPRPSAGAQTARAQAQARAPTRATSLAAGLHAGHTMRDACGPHIAGCMQTCEQTGRWKRTPHVMWTTAPRTTRTRSRAWHGHR
jgi:hypothetical protein